MSWLGNGFREEAQSLADAYASMYNKEETIDEAVPLAGLIGSAAGKLAAGGTAKATAGMAAKGGVKKLASKVATNVAGSATERAVTNKLSPKNEAPEFQSASVSEEFEIVDEYCVSVEDGIALEEGKKKCKDGYKWDSDKGKCVKKKKKSSSSNKTTVIVTGRGGYYGGLHGHGGHGGSNGGDSGEGETESGGGDGGGDGGGGGE